MSFTIRVCHSYFGDGDCVGVVALERQPTSEAIPTTLVLSNHIVRHESETLLEAGRLLIELAQMSVVSGFSAEQAAQSILTGRKLESERRAGYHNLSAVVRRFIDTSSTDLDTSELEEAMEALK